MTSPLADDGTRPAFQSVATAADWAVSRYIRLGRREVRYREAGAGTPIVLLHGLGVSVDYWVRNGPALAALGFRVLAPDLPGFGRSDGGGNALDVRAQAEFVRAWSRALGLPPAVYMAHSLSCQTALQLAANDTAIVRGLVLAAPTGHGRQWPRMARQAVGLIRDVFREPLSLAVLVGRAYLHAGPVRVLETWRLGAKHDPLPLLDRIDVPGIVVIGERDPIVRPAFARVLAEGLRGGRVITIPDAAHAVIFDVSGEINRVVAHFVRTLDDAAPNLSSEPV